MVTPPPPAHHARILEINVISAEDLAPISRNMKTYAMVWVNPEEKLTTGVDETSGTDPTWNDAFNFRVEEKFLNSEDAAIVVEIYAAAWVKDALVGYVNVLLRDIFHMRSIADAKMKNSATRTVALQVRRPSGRPQGILNVKVSLLDSSIEDLKPKATNEIKETNVDDDENNKNNQPEYHQVVSTPNANAKMSRSRSNGTDLTMEEGLEKGPDMGSMVNCETSEVKGGSMVNGDSLCNSDVGPSASVVAAAIAKGLYVPTVQTQAPTTENKMIREWTRKERGESLDMKLERWRAELAQPVSVNHRQANSTKGKKSRGIKGNDGTTTKLFSCFGNAFGCEISITCGGKKKKHGNANANGNGNGNNKICHLSSVDENYSQSIL